LRVVPCLDAYGPCIDRAAMEAQPGVFFPTRHADFMMEKANLLEWALSRAEADGDDDSGALFLDCDVTCLAPLPPVPVDAAVAVSPHGIRPLDEELFGRFNGGCFFVRDPGALYQWRRATHRSRYFDQASIEDVARWATEHRGARGVFEFPPQVNYGYWRMFQSHRAAEEEVADFSLPGEEATAPGAGPVRYRGAPLQSVHTHFHLPTGARAVPLFNRLIRRWAAANPANAEMLPLM